MRVLLLAVGILALATGPWGGVNAVADNEMTPTVGTIDPVFGLAQAESSSQEAEAGGCGCKQVVLNLTNIVREAELTTGDARVRNISVTYVSREYVANGAVEVTIEQFAEAISGDAIAGQIAAVLADNRDGGCTDVIVKASNHVEDAELETGDAVALNQGVVLMDPGVSAAQVEIDWDQVARARAGDAVVGQTIGVINESLGACGSVTLDLSSVVRRVDLKTGDAVARNEQFVEVCAHVGCAQELLHYTHGVDLVRRCFDRCAVSAVRDLVGEWRAAEKQQREDEAAVYAEPPPSEPPTSTVVETESTPEPSSEPSSGHSGPRGSEG